MKGNPEKYLLQKTSKNLLTILVPTVDPTPATVLPISTSNEGCNGACNHNEDSKSNSDAHQQIHCTCSNKFTPIIFRLPSHVRAQANHNWGSVNKKQSYLKHTQYLIKATKYRIPRTCIGRRQKVVDRTEGEHGEIKDGHTNQDKQEYFEAFLLFANSEPGTAGPNDNQECKKSYAENSRSGPAKCYQRD